MIESPRYCESSLRIPRSQAIRLRCLVRVFGTLLSVALFGAMLCPRTLAAQEVSEGEAELAAVLTRIENEETRLQEIRKREKELRSSLAKIQTDREKAKRATELLGESLEKLAAEQQQLANAIQEAKNKSVVLREGFEERLIAIYKTHRRSGSVDYLFR